MQIQIVIDGTPYPSIEAAAKEMARVQLERLPNLFGEEPEKRHVVADHARKVFDALFLIWCEQLAGFAPASNQPTLANVVEAVQEGTREIVNAIEDSK